ncbi:MAG TPA: CaiB/BaiF CoA-transferase family protein [Acidimicrobiales bacterium]|nr:CaiB/BaiF CoA-transferase family protein [Acidimicrobiales bacterium]
MTAALLEGLRVLDVGIWRPVPYATQLLAEMGADVLKVEPPGGDPMRVFPPLFDVLNAGKRSIVVDLKSDNGRQEVLALAGEADAFLEGFRPGVADRLGVGYEALRGVNPAIVYCSISGYGASGPLAAHPGHDVNYQAYAGVLSPRGGDPVAGSLPVGDLGAGMTAAMATVAACFRARTTGEGERIDVGIADVLATWTGAVGQLTPVGCEQPMDGLPGYGTYRTADDRYVGIGVLVEGSFWSGLCRALGLEGLGDLGLNERITKKGELDAAVADAVARFPLDEVVRRLEGVDVPVSPVLTRAEMLGLDHFRHRGTVLAGAGGSTDGPVMGHPARYAVHPAHPPGPVPGLADDRRRSWRAR